MLGAVDGERRSYVEIADALRAHGAAATHDLAELWRRIVFSVLISNTDDHLRNHGFLYAGVAGWRLSPVFDVNPVPTDIKDRVLSTAIGLDGDPTASLDIALEVGDAVWHQGLRRKAHRCRGGGRDGALGYCGRAFWYRLVRDRAYAVGV